MKRVTGIGGLFFKCADRAGMEAWYREHLGIDAGKYGASFDWRDMADPEKKCTTAWNLFDAGTKYFQPSEKPFMFNYRVENLKALLDALRAEGVQIVGEMEEYPYGRFGWIMDPEGNKIELWEPVDDQQGGA
jgi:predicted enzyme related to lactoylglutathione lyase